MSKLACLGGKPVVDNLVGSKKLSSRPDLEREYLLQAYDSGIWDDWPGIRSMAARFEREWAVFCHSKFCALLTNGTHTLQAAVLLGQLAGLRKNAPVIDRNGLALDKAIADDIWQNKAVVSHWAIYGCPPRRAKLLTDAIVKIHENRHDLLTRRQGRNTQ